jgi:hypothetical protein
MQQCSDIGDDGADVDVSSGWRRCGVNDSDARV